MSWTSIPHAHEYWRYSRHLADPPPNFEEAETFILQAAPHTPQDAACILDVVRSYAGDPRCDGLDYAALGRVQDYLSSLD
jgi:hypothetical protein